MKLKKLIAITAMSASLVACQIPDSNTSAANVYSRNEVAQGQKTFYGKLVSAKPVKIEGESSLIATGLGAGLAGYGASHIGGGKAKYASAAVGAVLGGMIGDALSTAATQSEGVEYTVYFPKTKETLTFVQEGRLQNLRIGQQVKVLIGLNGKARIDQ